MPRFAPVRTLFLTALALALAACSASGTRYWGQTHNALYSARSLGYVQAQGPTPLTVKGNPFPGAPADVFGQVVAATMSGANAGPPLRFTTDAPTRVGPYADYHVVVVFGTPWVGASDLCQVKEPEIEPTGKRVRAAAAFCIENKRIGEIKGEMAAEASGPDDPAFHDFLRGLTLGLMPPSEPRGRPGRCSPMAPC